MVEGCTGVLFKVGRLIRGSGVVADSVLAEAGDTDARVSRAASLYDDGSTDDAGWSRGLDVSRGLDGGIV